MASHKLLWDDEFYTLYLSTTSGWSDLQAALATGADQHPAPFYYLIHWITRLFGTSHITLRLPSIFGLWLFCVSLYSIVRRLTTPQWGAVALFAPLVTGVYWYSAEARGYALMAGGIALALLAWMCAAAGLHRARHLVLLAAGLAAATASHYYALVAIGPLVLGELVRTVTRKRVDWPVWLAFAAPAIPIAICLPALRSARKYAAHFWATPHWPSVFDFYPRMFSFLVDVLLLATVVILLLGLRRAVGSRDAETPIQAPRIWETAAFCAFAFLPMAVMIFAKTITHAYIERYAITGMLGALILVCVLLARFARGAPSAAASAAILLIVWFGIMVGVLLQRNAQLRENYRADLEALIESGAKPVALAEITVFHALSFYGPRNAAARFFYLADPPSAIKYLGHDTVDRGFLDLQPWFPLNIVTFEDFVKRNPRFLAYGYSGTWSWLTYRLRPPDFRAAFIGRIRNRMLLHVETLEPPTGSPPPAGNRLYDRLNVTAPTLCEHYMGTGRCPSLQSP